MINTLKPAATQGHDDQRSEVLEKIQREYGKPQDKEREAVKKLGKDEFFKIMITQIQHQDPLKPYQNEQMASQMAQFSALEQMVNVNSNIEKLTQAQQPLQNLGAASLIGKFVTADSSRVTHSEGKKTMLAFQLPVDAKKVRLLLVNERGENIREIEAGSQKKGEVSIEWDGKKDNNMPASSGLYFVQIAAANDKGQSIPVQTQKTSIVHGVGFEGKETVLLTGEIGKPQKLLLKNVSKIVDPGEAKALSKNKLMGPGGMEIGGLENLINAEGVQQLNPDEASAAGLSKFQAVNAGDMRGESKPDIIPERQLSPSEIAEALRNGPDLSGANPIAEALRTGKAPTPEVAAAGQVSERDIDSVNPAARAAGQSGGPTSHAAGQALPSGVDGSVAGKLME